MFENKAQRLRGEKWKSSGVSFLHYTWNGIIEGGMLYLHTANAKVTTKITQ